MTLERVDTLGAVPKLGLVGVRLDVIALSGVVVIRWFVITRVFSPLMDAWSVSFVFASSDWAQSR